MKPTGYEHSTNRELLLAIQVLEDRKSRIDKQIMLMKREMKRRKKNDVVMLTMECWASD